MDENKSAPVTQTVDQIGIVVRDLRSMVENLQDVLGIGDFRVVEWPVEGSDPQATYHGKPGDFRLLLGFATVGKTQLEIIEPLSGENIFSDFLEEHGPGLHHFRFTVSDFEERCASLESRGIEKIASGTGVHVGSKWAYFDTRSILEGVIVELRTSLDEDGGKGQWLK